MAEVDILNAMLDYGAMAILAGVLWYLTKQQRAERISQAKDFLAQLDKMREQARLETAQFHDERTALRSNLAQQITVLESKVANLSGKVDGLQLALEGIQVSLRELSTERRLEAVAKRAAARAD